MLDMQQDVCCGFVINDKWAWRWADSLAVCYMECLLLEKLGRTGDWVTSSLRRTRWLPKLLGRPLDSEASEVSRRQPNMARGLERALGRVGVCMCARASNSHRPPTTAGDSFTRNAMMPRQICLHTWREWVEKRYFVKRRRLIFLFIFSTVITVCNINTFL